MKKNESTELTINDLKTKVITALLNFRIACSLEFIADKIRENMQNLVGDWHDDPGANILSLAEYLGLTEEEYKKWVENDSYIFKLLYEKFYKEK